MAKSILQHSKIVSGFTLLSRITGLARDVILAAWLGNNWIQDSFKYAYTIPNLFRNLLGEGALSAAFVPLLSERLTQQDRPHAAKLVSLVATVLALVLVALTSFILILIAVLFLAADETSSRYLLLTLTALMIPYMIFVCLVALFAAVLNCLDRFALPAFMPILLNLFQIAALIAAPLLLRPYLPHPQQQIYVVALSVILAGIVQLLLMLRAVNKLGVKWSFHLDLRHPDLRRLAVMMGPMVLGLGILQFGTWLDNHIIVSLTAHDGKTAFDLFGKTVAYPLAEGTLSAVAQARLLYQFPLGVLAISLATVAFPTFSRHAADHNLPALADSITHTLRLALFEALPAGIGLIVLSNLIVKVVFERGNFTPAHTAHAAHVLRFYALGLWAYSAHHIIVRAFYSLKDTLTPLRIMSKTIVLALILNLTLIWVRPLRAAVFGLSTTIMASLNVIFLTALLCRRIPQIRLRPVLASAARTLLASLLMAAAAHASAAYLPLTNKYLLLLTSMALAALVFFAGCHLLRIPELAQLLPRRRRPPPIK